MKKTIETDYKKDCTARMLTVRDALDVISGKWKILILISLMAGNRRFREIERSIPKISSKVLAKELKDLEDHQLIKRTVYDSSPVLVEYTATDYVFSLKDVIDALHHWGLNHRKRILERSSSVRDL
ncbi:MAG: helix-turn-helix transcriptional regulator [Bacteroidetes bacterium]|nr:helix-turn-helix transcriptional regulator [Bacteroidota bacterium]